MYDKTVSLGSRLHYPITITKLLKSPGDPIKKQETIIEYKFTWRRKVSDDEWVDETTYTEYDSPAEGKLKEWRIKEGSVISADSPCMLVEEACGHEVQIQGLCSLCGADMTEVNWASEEKDTDRAMINMTHDQTGLMVSESVAAKAEHDTQKRLLRQRKLSLVVDLDQTIIHACIEPTIGEWQRDASNPNHDAVKEVKSFQLNDDGPRGLASGCTYYIKLRPGLQEFLEEVSRMYELHVYTMGTRAYALNIARIVDPDRKLFGNRVISRDENGSITSKSLQRLFPVSTNMVVIIDDRADVWPRNRPNLIKVVPYDFFKGIGDINSSFLPKRTDILPAPAQTNGPLIAAANNNDSKSQTSNGATPPEAKASPLQELARMGGADDEASLKIQAEEQEKTLNKQLTERPLLHMQEELDKEDELSAQEQETGDSSPGHQRQHLLSDDDEELIALQDHLTDLHSSFYDTYDRRRDERRRANPAHPPNHSNTRRRSSVDDGVDLSMVPDVGDILDELKSNVLSGLVIVLSGLVPLGVNIEDSEIGMQAQSFGAQVLDSVSRRVTHLVVSLARPRTKKVQQAAKIPSVKIVNHKWLIDCLSQWRRLDERPYYLNISADRERGDDTTEPTSEAENAEPEARDLKDFDWATADKDLEEFLGTDNEEDEEDGDDDEEEGDVDSETDINVESGTEADEDGDTDITGMDGQGKKGKKRKQLAEGEESDGDGVDIANESVLAKKQRLSRNRRASGLRSVRTPNGEDAAEEGRSLPTSEPTNDEVATVADKTLGVAEEATAVEYENEDVDVDVDDAELERELLAELEAVDE
ncbi:CTD phosphatase Fcp1 [Conoideocrella luteorostrata]|uniref:RNA polymerase II subunit A C-terminal domain phosphatase n=1 Tax=Conoideocrella luteorostrata TaxID=1105319 RepID=A0AAJ0CCX8_9HYPO|nr:CTD phosphatase Fcp1 [Conoideocrella luteorostrata]